MRIVTNGAARGFQTSVPLVVPGALADPIRDHMLARLIQMKRAAPVGKSRFGDAVLAADCLGLGTWRLRVSRLATSRSARCPYPRPAHAVASGPQRPDALFRLGADGLRLEAAAARDYVITCVIASAATAMIRRMFSSEKRRRFEAAFVIVLRWVEAGRATSAVAPCRPS